VFINGFVIATVQGVFVEGQRAGKRANRLIKEESLYLLQHAYNLFGKQSNRNTRNRRRAESLLMKVSCTRSLCVVSYGNRQTFTW
jgi:hypothetical protein